MKQSISSDATVYANRSVIRKLGKACLIATAGVALFTPRAQGDVYISNIGNFSSGEVIFDEDVWSAFAFTTDSGPYVLDYVSALLSLPANPIPDDASITAMLFHSNGSGKPMTQIGGASFTHTALVTGEQTVTFTPIDTIELEANSTYSLVITSSDVSGRWRSGGASGGTSSDVPGSSWAIPTSTFVKMGGPWMELSSDEFLLASVGASPIPEPSALVLLGTIGVAVLALRKRV